MKIIYVGSKVRFLIMFEHGEELRDVIKKGRSFYKKFHEVPLRASEKKVYSNAFMFKKIVDLRDVV